MLPIHINFEGHAHCSYITISLTDGSVLAYAYRKSCRPIAIVIVVTYFSGIC